VHNSVYNQLLGRWFANQNQNTKQKHPSLNAQGHRNWIRQRFVGATGHTRGRWAQFTNFPFYTYIAVFFYEMSSILSTLAGFNDVADF
jgi:hypothetical protein